MRAARAPEEGPKYATFPKSVKGETGAARLVMMSGLTTQVFNAEGFEGPPDEARRWIVPFGPAKMVNAPLVIVLKVANLAGCETESYKIFGSRRKIKNLYHPVRCMDIGKDEKESGNKEFKVHIWC